MRLPFPIAAPFRLAFNRSRHLRAPLLLHVLCFASRPMASRASSSGECFQGLLPADKVTFLEKIGAFTPLYEPAAPESTAAAPQGTFASVNAGAFALYIGGAAINAGFARALKSAGHDIDAYESFHSALYKAAEDAGATGLQHWSNEAEPPLEPLPKGLQSSAVLLSELPDRFIRQGSRAGTVFVDVFAEGFEPLDNAGNRAMVYVVGPEGSQAEDAGDFERGCEVAGENLLRAVSLHNKGQEGSKRIDIVRMCLVSGGLFRHSDLSKVEVAGAFIRGMSRGFSPQDSPHVQFAFDEDSFKLAYEVEKSKAAEKPKADTAAEELFSTLSVAEEGPISSRLRSSDPPK
mmetsp:Transcript_26161/g.62420  ORF Transcript_26161/g.62420 Transcript_26161/m.62420 type:complete len:347 (+) Transcript_26161:6-1046(+)